MKQLIVICIIGCISSISRGSYVNSKDTKCRSECKTDQHCDVGFICERVGCRFECVKKIIKSQIDIPVNIDKINGDIHHVKKIILTDPVNDYVGQTDAGIINRGDTFVSDLPVQNVFGKSHSGFLDTTFGIPDIQLEKSLKKEFRDPLSSVGIVGSNSQNLPLGPSPLEADILLLCIDNCVASTQCLEGTDCVLGCKKMCHEKQSLIDVCPVIEHGVGTGVGFGLDMGLGDGVGVKPINEYVLNDMAGKSLIKNSKHLNSKSIFPDGPIIEPFPNVNINSGIGGTSVNGYVPTIVDGNTIDGVNLIPKSKVLIKDSINANAGLGHIGPGSGATDLGFLPKELPGNLAGLVENFDVPSIQQVGQVNLNEVIAASGFDQNVVGVKPIKEYFSKDIGSEAYFGTNTGIGSDVHVVAGSGLTPHVGVGIGTGPHVGAGIGPGPHVGADIGPGPYVGADIGPGAHVGVGIGTGPHVGAGIGPGAHVGAGIGPGPHVGAGIDLGSHFGTGIGSGFGVDSQIQTNGEYKSKDIFGKQVDINEHVNAKSVLQGGPIIHTGADVGFGSRIVAIDGTGVGVQSIDAYKPKGISGDAIIIKDHQNSIFPNSQFGQIELTSEGFPVANMPFSPINDHMSLHSGGSSIIHNQHAIEADQHAIFKAALPHGVSGHMSQIGNNGAVFIPDASLTANKHVSQIRNNGGGFIPDLSLTDHQHSIEADQHAIIKSALPSGAVGQLSKIRQNGAIFIPDEQVQSAVHGNAHMLPKTALDVNPVYPGGAVVDKSIVVGNNGQIKDVNLLETVKGGHAKTQKDSKVLVTNNGQIISTGTNCYKECNRDFHCGPQKVCVERGCQRVCEARIAISPEVPVGPIVFDKDCVNKCIVDIDCPSGMSCEARGCRKVCVKQSLGSGYSK